MWRITGTEALAGPDPRDPWDGRRADVSWDDALDGLVVAPGSEWVVDRLRELDGGEAWFPGGPSFRVDLGDEASTYWTVRSLLYGQSIETENPPAPIWTDETPAGAVN